MDTQDALAPPSAARKQPAKPGDEQTESLGNDGPRELNPVQFFTPNSRDEAMARTSGATSADADFRPNVLKFEPDVEVHPSQQTVEHVFAEEELPEGEHRSSSLPGSKPKVQKDQPDDS